MKGTNQKPILRAALVGFVLGVAASGSYVALTGVPFFPPTWAQVLFYPGLVVGECIGMALHSAGIVPITMGCLTVGTEYALISVTLFLVGRGVRDRGNWGSTCPPPDTCPTDPNCHAADHCPTGDDCPPADSPNEQ